MSVLARLPNQRLAGGAERLANRSCVVHFMFGDSISLGWFGPTPEPAGLAPPKIKIWGQNSLFGGVDRDGVLPRAGVKFLPYGSGHGMVSPAQYKGSSDLAMRYSRALAARTGVNGSGPDHVFAQWGTSGARLATSPAASAVSFAVDEDGYKTFVEAHSVPMMAALRNLYGARVYMGATVAVSFGGDSLSTEVGSGAAFDVNFTAMLNAFHAAIGVTAADLPTFLCRAALTDQGGSFPEIVDLRDAQDRMDGVLNTTTIDTDNADIGPDFIHRTNLGTNEMAAMVAVEYAKISSFPLWTGF